jgi:hypothetical protein
MKTGTCMHAVHQALCEHGPASVQQIHAELGRYDLLTIRRAILNCVTNNHAIRVSGKGREGDPAFYAAIGHVVQAEPVETADSIVVSAMASRHPLETVFQ